MAQPVPPPQYAQQPGMQPQPMIMVQPQPVMMVQPMVMHREYADPCLRMALMIWNGIGMLSCLMSGISAAQQRQPAAFVGFLGLPRAILGFVGAYQEHVCMLTAYWIWGIVNIIGCAVAIGLLSWTLVEPPEVMPRVEGLPEEQVKQIFTVLIIVVLVVVCIGIIEIIIQICLARKLIKAIEARNAENVQPVAFPPA